MRKLIAILMAAAIVAAACGGSSATTKPGDSQAPAASSGVQATPDLTSATHSTPAPSTAALGTGVVKVTLGGKEYTVGGGDCAKGFGGDFFVVEAGDWLNGIDPAATSDFVSVSIYNDGSAQHAGGRVGGTKFFYSDATGTGDITKGGTFTGTDAYGAGTVSGTFSCK